MATPKRVFIAGIAGFLGSHIAELYRSKDVEVIGIDNLTKFELNRTGYKVEDVRNYNVNFLKSINAKLVVGDIRDIELVRLTTKSCDYIINTAAQPAMTVALEDPHYDADNNIMGTLNLLQVAREMNIPVALCSTIHVYGNGINDEIFEDTDGFYRKPSTISEKHKLLTGQITPLHVSKYATELYARAFTESYGTKVAIFRLTGIYGPRQFGGEDHGWVANFCIRTLLDMPIKVFGTDKQVRDILYVKDAAQAFSDWYENGQKSGVYNVGGGKPCIVSIKDVLRMLETPEDLITLEPARKGDLYYFCCNYSKARESFRWTPKVLPKEGLKKLVEWVEKNRSMFRK